MRVAQIGHKRIPSREGGIEIVVEQLSTGLVNNGCKVDAYNRSGYHVSGKEFNTHKSRFYKGIRLITIPTFSSKKLNAIVYSILATIRATFTGYDIYHFHAEGPCIMMWLPKLFHKKVVATIHGLDWQRAKWGNFASKVLIAGEKMAVKKADEIIVLSKSMQDYFMETYGRRTILIPNGVSKPTIAEAKEISEKWGLKKDEYILFLARIVPEKGLHYLIDAYKQLNTDKKLVIAGGSSHSEDYLQKIHKMAEDDKRIIFTHFVQGRKLEELYSNAYMFVLPSDVEGMSIGLLEAMSYGNSCLVSDIPENAEVVGDAALTFIHGNSGDLREKMKLLLDDSSRNDIYKTHSAEYICTKFSWDDIVRRTLDIYKNVLIR